MFSKEEIYSSRVKYFVKKGRPYLWVPEKELHNVVKFLFLGVGIAGDGEFS